MTGKNLDPYMGRAFVGDGLATLLSASAGGTGVTTYAENIGVMAVTKIYSTLIFVAAAVVAIVLGFSPKFGALIHTIPGPVLGGASIVVFGLLARRWDWCRGVVVVASVVASGDIRRLQPGVDWLQFVHVPRLPASVHRARRGQSTA